MKYELFSIYDRLSHLYGNPFVQVNKACAVRYFANIVQKNEDMPAGDYDLVSLGSWDPEHGVILMSDVEVIKNGAELLEVSA